MDLILTITGYNYYKNNKIQKEKLSFKKKSEISEEIVDRNSSN